MPRWTQWGHTSSDKLPLLDHPCENAENLGKNPIISYLFIAVVIKYSLRAKGGVPETKVVQKRQFITTNTASQHTRLSPLTYHYQ